VLVVGLCFAVIINVVVACVRLREELLGNEGLVLRVGIEAKDERSEVLTSGGHQRLTGDERTDTTSKASCTKQWRDSVCLGGVPCGEIRISIIC